jgi:hypothetical protein
MRKSKVDIFDYHEKYRLPVMITQRDIEMEKIYLNYYNDTYWEKYKKHLYIIPFNKVPNNNQGHTDVNTMVQCVKEHTNNLKGNILTE